MCTFTINRYMKLISDLKSHLPISYFYLDPHTAEILDFYAIYLRYEHDQEFWTLIISYL